MLCRRTLELPKSAPRLPRSLIPREELANWAQANQLIGHARVQADELLRRAEQQCKTLQEQASLEIWQRADAQLQRWAHDRQAMCDKLEQYASSITQNAIRYLLDETATPARLAALVRQLLANQIQAISATLLCHPNDLEEIKQCLVDHRTTIWKLQADETIPSQTLVLKTDEGDFRISWHSMLDAFFKHGNEFWIDT
ncbi:type III secretion system stator protein SctL [Pseudomonas sp. SDO5271_S396]